MGKKSKEKKARRARGGKAATDAAAQGTKSSGLEPKVVEMPPAQNE